MDLSRLKLEKEELEKAYRILIDFYLPKSGDLSEIDVEILNIIKKIRDRIRPLRTQIMKLDDKDNEFNTPEHKAHLKALEEKFKSDGENNV